MRHITYTDRLVIEALNNNKICVKEIAKELHFSISAIYRELKRGQYTKLTCEYEMIQSYSADIAQKDHEEKKENQGVELKIGKDHKLAAYIEKKIIKEHYSPEAVIGEIRRKGLKFDTEICTKTLYNYIDQNIFLNLSYKHLLRKKKSSAKNRTKENFRIKRPLSRGIEQRTEGAANRNEFGHWEMDTVVGKAKGKGQALLVLTERMTRQEIILKLNGKNQASVTASLNRLERKFGAMFKKVFKTITVDNGSEFLDSEALERSCRTKSKRTTVYYCHPYSSWERGSNENANAIIRRFVLKGTPIENYSEKRIKEIEDWINHYPRKILGFYCSQDLFMKQLELIKGAQ